MNTEVKCSIIEASSNELLYQIEVHNGLIPAYIVKKHDGSIPYIHTKDVRKHKRGCDMRSKPTCQHTPTRGYQGTVLIHGSLGTGAFSNSPALYSSLTSPGPSRVHLPLLCTCIGDPIPYPCTGICGSTSALHHFFLDQEDGTATWPSGS